MRSPRSSHSARWRCSRCRLSVTRSGSRITSSDCGPASLSTTPPRPRQRGSCFSDETGKVAVLVKSVRNALIGFVVLGFALYWVAHGEADAIAPGVRAKAAFVWEKFPKFVLGFLA